MIVSLRDAVPDTCGGKAAALGALLRAGVPVPDGFVVPFAAYRSLGFGTSEDLDAVRRAIEARPVGADLVDALGRALGELGDPFVAVRSSAAGEDTAHASAAGRHDSFLGVRGVGAAAGAVRACWASLFSPRAVGGSLEEPVMAVIVQRHLDADVSGVMFTPGATTDIEATWGLGPSVVEGKVTPDAFRVSTDGTVTSVVASKRTRLDRRGADLVVSDVLPRERHQPVIDDATAAELARLGGEIAAVLGGPQDIEWAIVGGRIWILQARPITAAPPPPVHASAAADPARATGTRAGATGGRETAVGTLTGTPGSRGTVTGVARVVRGRGDFGRVQPGDILICPFTDPAWTPLLRIASGVVTETGGVLCHAAIVAREHAIPAVLGIPDATSRLRDGAVITVDGSTGTVTEHTPTPRERAS
ncbi:PEP/pyruvate-binding domain-containing protein [Nonomuraea sp. NPDC050556]|uniref:PEP/pyruvate-binding domain-containing protein n=1 Tax=Nonomuraea sp. NPDC050556 TaxID=3364369 RepID=UPI003796E3DB